MELDFRVDAGIFSNAKILRLNRRLGGEQFGLCRLLQLWAYARQHRQDGVLRGMSDEDIAIAAGWPVDRAVAEFVDALRELRLLDAFDERLEDRQLPLVEPERPAELCWQIHDWREAQPWSAGTAGRRAHAQRLNHNRWHKGVVDPHCVICESDEESEQTLEQRSELKESGIRTDRDAVSSESVGESSVPHREENPSDSPPPSLEKNVRKKHLKREFTADSRPYRAAVYLLDKIRVQSPEFDEPDLQRWARDFDALFRIDARDPAVVADVIDAVTEHPRLRAFLRSPGAMRATEKWPDGSRKWDTFVDAVRSDRRRSAEPDVRPDGSLGVVV